MRISRRSALAIGFGALSGCSPKRGSGFEGHAFVANEDSQTVAAVDLLSFNVARQIPVTGSPAAVLAHPLRPFVYVLTPQTGAVHEIDVARLSVTRKVNTARRAVSMRLAPDGDSLWVLCRDPRQLSQISLEPFRNTARIALDAEPFDFDFSPDGRLCAVSFGAEGTVSMFSPAGGRAGPMVPAGKSVNLVRFRSDGKHLLAGNAAERRLAVLDAPSGRVVVNLPLAVRPDQFCFKTDGGQLFVTGEGMDAVVIVYPYTTEVAATVLAGRTPGAMAVSKSPDREYLFVANTQSGDLTILNIDTHRVIAVVSVGEEPACVAVTPDDQYALALNRRSGTLAVIRIAGIVPRRTRWASLFTAIPVGSKPVSLSVKAS